MWPELRKNANPLIWMSVNSRVMRWHDVRVRKAYMSQTSFLDEQPQRENFLVTTECSLFKNDNIHKVPHWSNVERNDQKIRTKISDRLPELSHLWQRNSRDDGGRVRNPIVVRYSWTERSSANGHCTCWFYNPYKNIDKTSMHVFKAWKYSIFIWWWPELEAWDVVSKMNIISLSYFHSCAQIISAMGGMFTTVASSLFYHQSGRSLTRYFGFTNAID